MNETTGIPLLDSMPTADATRLLQWCGEIIEGQETLASLRGFGEDDLNTIYKRAYEAWQAGEHEAAAMDFAYFAMHQPNDPRFMFALGYAMQHRGEFQEALNFYSRAVLMRKNDPGAIYRISQCLTELGDIDGARDALDFVIALCYGKNEMSELDTLLELAMRDLQKLNI
jgi:type III secretion system low calcium response chaperone LcrH/SycD